MRCELNAVCISIRIDKAQRLACAACFESVVATIAVNYYHIHVHDTRFLVARVGCTRCLLIPARRCDRDSLVVPNTYIELTLSLIKSPT